MIKQMLDSIAILTCFWCFFCRLRPRLTKTSDDKGLLTGESSIQDVFAGSIIVWDICMGVELFATSW